MVGGVMAAALAWSLMATAPYCNLVQSTGGTQSQMAIMAVRLAHIPHLLAQGHDTLQ